MKVLIANRGEIAVRIERTLRDMGFTSVAVSSDPDKTALHVLNADEVVHIGGDTPLTSYLDKEKIIHAALKTKAQLLHPGYGFLSERPDFAEDVLRAGLRFVGPSPEAMALAGDKVQARKMARRAGIPLLEGSDALTDVNEALKIAEDIGYPVMIKAAAGGGGKGMRVAKTQDELKRLFKLASEEAQSAFGDGRLYIERLVLNPHHVEVQVIADEHGNVFALGERECSLQRRHQKFIEESPSPVIDETTRREILEAAVEFARIIGYTNAGTVEFLYDEDKGKFYFLEMNARLQVEHPVTEMRTGLDLVELQIRVALGEELSLERIHFTGWAIEARVNAEDPYEDFLPSTGRIVFLQEPSGPFVRLDSGVYQGYEVPVYYDPLIAKVIAWGTTRTDALRRLRRALEEYRVFGISTNIPYLLAVLESKAFSSGRYTTNFTKEFRFETDLPEDLIKISVHLEGALEERSYTPVSRYSSWRQRLDLWEI